MSENVPDGYDLTPAGGNAARSAARPLLSSRRSHRLFWDTDPYFRIAPDLIDTDAAGGKVKVLVRVDRWFPSSQLCSCCGHRNTDKKDLSVRRWACPVCGAQYDRDVIAAANIGDEGIRQ